MQTEGRKEAVSRLRGSQLRPPPAFPHFSLSLLPPPLSASPFLSLIVFFTRLLSFNVISLLSPSHAPPSPSSSFFFLCFCVTVCLSFSFHLLFHPPPLSNSIFLSSALLFLLLSFHLPPTSVSLFLSHAVGPARPYQL